MKTSYIRDVTVNYVFLTQNKLDKYGKLSLQIEFGKDRVQELSQYGNMKVLENGNFGINLSTNPRKVSGEPKSIAIIDLNKQPVTAIVGNGSKVDLKVFTYKHERATNGQKTAPMAMLVKELKEYVQENINDFEILPEDAKKVNTSQADF